MRYRFRGTDRAGNARLGVATMPEAELAAWVRGLYRCRWRELVVCEGEGPVPPGPDEDSVAEIGPHVDSGHRCWWAASPVED
jgi:hypothetical protein